MWSRCNSGLIVLLCTPDSNGLSAHWSAIKDVKWYWTPRILFPRPLIATSQPNYPDALNLHSSALATPRTLLSILVAILAPPKQSSHLPPTGFLSSLISAFSLFSTSFPLPHQQIYYRCVNICRVRDLCRQYLGICIC